MPMRRTIFEPEHDAFRDSARRFFQTEIAPHAERWREAGVVDREAFRKAGQQGLLLMWADEKYGGAGVQDFRYEQVLIEENMRFGEPGFFINLHSRLVGPYIGQLGTEEQKDRLLPAFVSGEKILAVAMTEPGAGSDVAGMKSPRRGQGRSLAVEWLEDLHLERTARGRRGRCGADGAGRALRNRSIPGRTRHGRLRTRTQPAARSACTDRTPPSFSSTT